VAARALGSLVEGPWVPLLKTRTRAPWLSRLDYQRSWPPPEAELEISALYTKTSLWLRPPSHFAAFEMLLYRRMKAVRARSPLTHFSTPLCQALPCPPAKLFVALPPTASARALLVRSTIVWADKLPAACRLLAFRCQLTHLTPRRRGPRDADEQ